MILSAHTFVGPVKLLFILVAFDAALRRRAYLPLYYGLKRAIFNFCGDLICSH